MTKISDKERVLREEELYRNAFQHAAIGMTLVAPSGKWIMVNKALCDLTGYSETELLTVSFNGIARPDDLERYLDRVRQMLAGEVETCQMETRYLHKNGNIINLLVSLSIVWDEDGSPLHLISQLQDITEKKRLEDELVRQATEDVLTGISNRRHFYELAGRELVRAGRYMEQVTLLMLDIDYFKKINDKFGHIVGDLTLKKVAEACKKELRSLDIFGRVGGEEFCALLVKADARTGRRIAERLRKTVEQLSIPAEKGPIRLTISIGGVSFVGSSQSLDDRVNQADSNLYAAKAAGRNLVIVTDEVTDRERSDVMAAGLVRLEWMSSYESGNAVIDEQHRRLLDRAHALIADIIVEKEGGISRELLNELISEVAHHFASEERILTEAGYPKVKSHATIHRNLIRKATALTERHGQGHLYAAEVLHFVVMEMISQHMIMEDHKFFPFLQAGLEHGGH